MNPLTNVKNITKLNETELKMGIDSKNSWHNMYSQSAWIFVGGLNYELSEGDVITVFSQYGEVVNINLIRDQKTGKSKGFCFICYEDQRSTILAVDNLNGIKLLNRTIRVDHVEDYKIPKEHEDMDEMTKKLHNEGCAPEEVIVKPEDEVKQIFEININVKKEGKHRKRKHSKHRRSSSSSSNHSYSSSSSSSSDSKRRKRESKSKDKRKEKKNKLKQTNDRRYDSYNSNNNGYKSDFKHYDTSKSSKSIRHRDVDRKSRDDYKSRHDYRH
ncbi:RNA-binding motif protein, X-linked 2-like [Oppia nitens]|uniref:RNA-binding motif protein, X-linked 2-like n=1 Tax=Oppia nitens TaxID=1686743 RepID=UPI0023DB8D50|nr:RNA-binding motif protein, X-linked 2-like [Oppia nitens]